jgi:hypothetical protein
VLRLAWTKIPHASCIYILYLCEFHRWMALRRELVALAHMPRIRASRRHPHAIARDRTRSQEHTRAHACPHVCTHTRARLGGAAAHNGPAPHRRPAECEPPEVARRLSREGGEYHVQRGDPRGVPRADVNVKRRRTTERLRAEAECGRRRRKALACVGADAWAPNRTRTRARARAQQVGACMRWARIGDPFIGVARRAWI